MGMKVLCVDANVACNEKFLNSAFSLFSTHTFLSHSYALRYLHRVMSHSLFLRKEGDSIVTTMELSVLYCMVNNIKLNVCHVIASKFKDVATKRAGTIKIGGLVLSIANYLVLILIICPLTRFWVLD